MGWTICARLAPAEFEHAFARTLVRLRSRVHGARFPFRADAPRLRGDAALTAHGYPRMENRRVDTVAIGRRLVRDEVPNLKLATLARHFRASVEPVHRAYADAAATAEVFHAMLERAAAFGVLGLDDLL